MNFTLLTELYFTNTLLSWLIVTLYTLFQAREVMLFGVAHTPMPLFTQKIPPVLEYAPQPLILRQRGDYSKHMSSKDCESVE